MPESIQPHQQNIKHTESGGVTVYDMVGNQFTRNALYYKSAADYKNKNPFMIKKIIAHDEKTGLAEGVYQTVLKNKQLKDKKRFVVDFNALTETVFTTIKSKTTEEVSKLNPTNFSTVEKSIYYPNGHLKSIESLQKDHPAHRQILVYHNPDYKIPNHKVSNVKNRLASFSLYENGHRVFSSIFNTEGALRKKIIADKHNPENLRYEDYTYYNDHYTIAYLNNQKQCYQLDLMRDGHMERRDRYDQKKQTVFIESNEYAEEQGRDPKCTKQQFYPDKWDENGRILSGTMKRFEDNTLTACGPFKQINQRFITEGQHLYKKGEVRIYKDGGLLQSYKEDIFEYEGELMVKPHTTPDQMKLLFPKRKNH